MVKRRRPSICVYCGSRPGADPAFAAAAREVGERIAARGLALVFGAGEVGLMGEVARAAQNAGAYTLGVIPEHLERREVGNSALSSYVVTETMHERKKVMFMNADAVVALPGGPGTLDELFEVLTWRQLGLHRKPVYLLNVSNYWAPLLGLIDHVAANGFCEPSFAESLTVVSDPEALFAALERDLPPAA